MNIPSYMNAAEMLDRMFDVYKKTFWPNLGVNLVISIIGTVVMMVAYLAFSVTVIMAVVSNPYVFDSPDFLFSPGIFTSFVTMIGVVFVFALIYSGMSVSTGTFFSDGVFRGERPSFGKVFKKVFSSLGRLLTATLAQFILVLPVLAVAVLIIIGILSLFAGSFYSIGNFFMDANFSGGFIAILVLFVLVFIFVSLLLSTVFAITIPVAVLEKRHFFGAVKRAYQLVKPDFWKTLGIMLVWGLVLSALMYSVYGLFYLAIGVFSIFSEAASADAAAAVMIALTFFSYIASAFLSLLVMPFTGILPYIIYYNQKSKSEGLDIAVNLHALFNKYGAEPKVSDENE